MATVYAPIAKDSSIKTTESPSRNIADVLAQELSGIANAITGGADKAPKTDIATVEPTNTASRAYSVGELVYVDGNLYKVITAISIGSTFTVGTNIQSTNVSQATNKVTTGTLTLSVTTTVTGNIYADTRDRTGLIVPKPNPDSVLLGVVVNPETPYNQSFWVGRLVSTGNTIDRMFIFSPNAMSDVLCTFRYFAFWA